MSKNQITTTSRNPYYSPLSKIFDGFWDDDYGYGIKNGTYEVNVAGYSKNEVTVEQEGNLVLVEADNDITLKSENRRVHFTGDGVNTSSTFFDVGFNTLPSSTAILQSENGIAIGADSGHAGIYTSSNNGYGDIYLNSANGTVTLYNNGFRSSQLSSETQGDLKIYTDLQNQFDGSRTLNATFSNDDLTVQGDITSVSDVRTKENIETVENSLDLVSQLRGVWYNKIGKDERKVGVIAQEVEEVLPEVVHTDAEGMKAVDYGKMVGVLIEAIKDLKAEIEELKAQ